MRGGGGRNRPVPGAASGLGEAVVSWLARLPGRRAEARGVEGVEGGHVQPSCVIPEFEAGRGARSSRGGAEGGGGGASQDRARVGAGPRRSERERT